MKTVVLRGRMRDAAALHQVEARLGAHPEPVLVGVQ